MNGKGGEEGEEGEGEEITSLPVIRQLDPFVVHGEFLLCHYAAISSIDLPLHPTT